MHSTVVSAAVIATLPISGHGHSHVTSKSLQLSMNTSGLSQQKILAHI